MSNSLIQRKAWLESSNLFENHLGSCLIDEKKVYLIQRLMGLLTSYFHKHKIFYFCMAGTALGALRHKGQIPWDPDADIGMVDTDFKRLLESEEFSSFLKANNIVSGIRRNGNGFFTIRSPSLGTHMSSDVFVYRKVPRGLILKCKWNYLKNYNHIPTCHIKTKYLPWCGIQVKVLEKIVNYTISMYGPTWMAPRINHLHHFGKDKLPKSERFVNARPKEFKKYEDVLIALRVPLMKEDEFWSLRYSFTSDLPKEPSSFGLYVLKTYPQNLRHLVEFGCGNGRDALFFSNQDEVEDVVAIDSSSSLDNTEKLTFYKEDVARLSGSTLEALRKATIVYMRFFLHAIPESVRNDLLSTITLTAPPGCMMCIEARSINDPMPPPPDHLRFPLNPESFRCFKGWKTLHLEESTGLSPHKDEDPLLIRGCFLRKE